jgi:hypothetical protein
MTKAPISRETQNPEVSSTQLMRTIPQFFFRSLKSKGLKRAVGIHCCKNHKVKRIFWRVRKMVFRRSRVTYPLFYPKKKWEESIVRVFGFIYSSRFSHFYRKKRWEAGSKASVVRVFGFFITPGSPLFFTVKTRGKQRVWI